MTPTPEKRDVTALPLDSRESPFQFRRLRFVSSHGWSLKARIWRLRVAVEIGWVK